MNVFNLIAGAGGGKSEGLYIWKKSEWSNEHRINILRTGEAQNVYYPNFDNCQMFDSNGNYVGKSTVTVYTDIIKDYYYLHSSGICYLVTNNNGTSIGTIKYPAPTSSLVYYEVIEPHTTAFIGYVISDKEDAYPDGAEQGGFYYERYAPYSLDDLGCTKYETGSVNYTSTTTYISINHSLGVVPKFAIIYKTDDKKHYLDYEIYAFTSPNGTYGGGAGMSTYASELAYSGTSAEASSTTIWLGYNGRNSNWHFYGAYSYIILA